MTAHPADEFLQLFLARDWRGLRALFAADCVWTMPGAGALSGPVHGPDALTERAKHVADSGVQTQLLHRLEGASGVAFILRNTAEADGRALDEHLATVVTVADEAITRIDTYLSDVDGKNAFFVEPGGAS